jgi:ABC-type branched-subunit amino acid transport system ATPase component
MGTLFVSALLSDYGDIKVINGVDLALNAGEFLGIFGHNGMGNPRC